jgi:hypothetical protein
MAERIKPRKFKTETEAMVWVNHLRQQGFGVLIQYGPKDVTVKTTTKDTKLTIPKGDNK